MNEIQYARNNLVGMAKGRVATLEDQLAEARYELHTAKQRLQESIDADPASWHATPGILK